MTPSHVDMVHSAGRIALVGAAGGEGVRLRKALEALQVSGSRVDLFGAGAAILSEYNGEARMIVEADRAALEDHQLIFVCDTAGDADRFLSEPATGATTIDMTGEGYGSMGVPLAHDRYLLPEERAAGSAWAVPHSLSLLLADILAPLREGPGVQSASAVFLRPAADFGAGAVDELKQQTLHLLNFESPPVEHLGRQLAFNVIPGEYMPGDVGALSDRIVRELAELLGLLPATLSVDLLAVPMFYGHGVSLQITTGEPVSPEALYPVLDAGEGLRASPDDVECTPMEVNGRAGISIAAIRAEPGGGNRIRLWAAADEADSAPAVQAIRLARQFGVL